MRKFSLLILAVILYSSCRQVSDKENPEDSNLAGDQKLILATLYNYYSAEYKALTLQAFNIASDRLDKIASSGDDLSKLAIVVDIDETILDNSPYQALLATTNKSYPEMWNEWCNMAVAKPIPGALKFMKFADSLGFSLFYISNRKEKETGDGTYRNLSSLGFPQLNENRIYLRKPVSDENPDPSNKEHRRKLAGAMGYEIVMLIGDNLGDFFSDSSVFEKRETQVNSESEKFGQNYIVLPNAMYGNWTGSLGIGSDTRIVDSLLLEMTRMFRDEIGNQK